MQTSLRLSTPRRSALILAASIATLSAASVQAADQTWKSSGFTDGNWATGANWVGGAAPGASSTAGTDPDTATFNGASNLTVTVDATRSIKNITFDTASAGAFTLQTGTLHLTNAGAVTINSSV